MNNLFTAGFWVGVAAGIAVTAALVVFSLFTETPAQKECQLNLPRTEKCKLTWVPASTAGKKDTQ